MKINFITAEDGDWIGMYIDSKLVLEGHSLDARDAVELILKETGGTVESKEMSEEWFETQGGRCPYNLPKE